MQFADKRRNTALVIQGGLGPTQLRDDGIAPDPRAADGVYATVVQINAEQFNRTRQQRIEQVRSTALQALTNQFTLCNADPSKLPNRSAINQVRTNEFALADVFFDIFWQLRESKLQLNKGPFAGRLGATWTWARG